MLFRHDRRSSVCCLYILRLVLCPRTANSKSRRRRPEPSRACKGCNHVGAAGVQLMDRRASSQNGPDALALWYAVLKQYTERIHSGSCCCVYIKWLLSVALLVLPVPLAVSPDPLWHQCVRVEPLDMASERSLSAFFSCFFYCYCFRGWRGSTNRVSSRAVGDACKARRNQRLLIRMGSHLRCIRHIRAVLLFFCLSACLILSPPLLVAP